ncbi:MAG: AzlC family ABC transporter permease [Oceanospirillaceae bacterium]|nr:AzlC family ABC transporter permease [Oceanospirillaceae bacterium]
MTPVRLFLTGARDTLPLILAAIPFGIVYGALAMSNGLSEWATLAISLFVFAGSAQFIAVTLVASAAALPVILLTVFVVNLRHMLYAASLMPWVSGLPQRLRALMAFWLTDETYAVVTNRIGKDPELTGLPWYYCGSALAMYGNWVFCTWLGITVGQQLPSLTDWGLDVAMVVAFIGIVVPALRNRAQWACALSAGTCALLTHDWPHQSGLLFTAVVAIAIGVTLERRAANTARETLV